MSMEKPKAAAQGGTEWTNGKEISWVSQGVLEA